MKGNVEKEIERIKELLIDLQNMKRVRKLSKEGERHLNILLKLDKYLPR
jgi:hypothetical protein